MRTDGASRARIGDYLLGLMDDGERQTFEADMAADPDLAAATARFAKRLSSLDATAAEAAVPEGMWDRITARLDETPQTLPAKKIEKLSPSRRLMPMALAASLLVGVALGYGASLLMPAQQQPVVIVVLNTPDNQPGAVFEAFADNSVRIVPLESFAVPEGKVMQVWTLYDKAVGPVSLGTLQRSDVVTLGGQDFPRPAADQLYEITLEQAPGSPTGKPTGPILVKGFARTPAG